ncbi:TonB-dependent receptor [Steroidobacter sp. S1-65]|uniref:TonB-dependent receptor n=1 Tax=Steroidobacter gossypii TaxID=2805490 RepID=A0ABS1WY10_9GAMM|nr:TonB-dependent receptor [Steroidobacter gossypii]MBM0105853.1 TonB-dependent receptor [Steroidobacter gossypii]
MTRFGISLGTTQTALLAPIAAAAVAIAPAHAQSSHATVELRLSIPASDLGAALSAFSRATDIQVVVDPALITGKRSAALSGSFTADEALTRLLDGSGLSFTLAGDTALVQQARENPAATRPNIRTSAAAPVQVYRQPAVEQSEPIEEIVVSAGFADSLARALDEKRQASNVIDVISAEDIGKFPTQNLAEALQRVPGVSITRDRGEGLFVRVRGLGPSFQIVNVNGRGAAVNENVRDSGQSGRQFRFDTLPSELVASVEVAKSPTAALDEGAIGGIVNVRTFRPLSLERSTVAGSAVASSPELADTIDPRVSGLASWINDDANFGLLVSAVYDERTLRQDRITGVTWTDESAGVDTDGDGAADTGSVLVPTATRPTLEREDRERIGVNGALQWQPSEDLDVNLDLFYTQLKDHYDELTYSAGFDLSTIVPGSAVITDGVLRAATAEGTSQIGREVSDLRHDNIMVGLNAEYRLGDWTLDADAVYAHAESDTPTPITRTRLLGPVGRVTFDFPQLDDQGGDVVPSVSFLDADLNNPGLLPGRRVEWRDVESTDEELAFQLDARRPIDFAALSELQFGAKYRTRFRDYDRRDYNFTRGVQGRSFDASFFEPFPEGNFLRDAAGSLPRSWVMPNPSAFATQINLAELNAPLSRGDLRNSYRVDEDIASAYAMSNLESNLLGKPLRGNFGVRVARTEQTSAGHADDGTRALPVSFDREYTDILPSLNLAWDWSDDVQTHFAAAKVITRPSLADLAPRLTLNSSGTIFEAVGGNPQLKPFEAWQYDATVEWYFAPGSALLGGVFYKDITTFMTRQRSNLVIDGTTYVLTAPVNGGDASVTGVEIAYQQMLKFLPAPFDGLGVLANYTHTDTEATYYDGARVIKDDLENVAKNSFNITAFYEHAAFAARLSYSWQDDVLQEVGTNGLGSANDKAFGSLDVDLSYRLNEQITVFAQGINVTDEAQLQFVRDDWFSGYTRYGRTLMLGMRAKY